MMALKAWLRTRTTTFRTFHLDGRLKNIILLHGKAKQ